MRTCSVVAASIAIRRLRYAVDRRSEVGAGEKIWRMSIKQSTCGLSAASSTHNRLQYFACLKVAQHRCAIVQVHWSKSDLLCGYTASYEKLYYFNKKSSTRHRPGGEVLVGLCRIRRAAAVDGGGKTLL